MPGLPATLIDTRALVPLLPLIRMTLDAGARQRGVVAVGVLVTDGVAVDVRVTEGVAVRDDVRVRVLLLVRLDVEVRDAVLVEVDDCVPVELLLPVFVLVRLILPVCEEDAVGV